MLCCLFPRIALLMNRVPGVLSPRDLGLIHSLKKRRTCRQKWADLSQMLESCRTHAALTTQTSLAIIWRKIRRANLNGCVVTKLCLDSQSDANWGAFLALVHRWNELPQIFERGSAADYGVWLAERPMLVSQQVLYRGKSYYRSCDRGSVGLAVSSRIDQNFLWPRSF